MTGRPARRPAIVAAAVLLAGGGFLASTGLAHAGDEPDGVGAPGEDGQDVTCTAYLPPVNMPVCNAVGADGADGATGVDR
ncbi:hypothetical protein ACU61A_34205 [Pseudonocardia sichuanensis]